MSSYESLGASSPKNEAYWNGPKYLPGYVPKRDRGHAIILLRLRTVAERKQYWASLSQGLRTSIAYTPLDNRYFAAIVNHDIRTEVEIRDRIVKDFFTRVLFMLFLGPVIPLAYSVVAPTAGGVSVVSTATTGVTSPLALNEEADPYSARPPLSTVKLGGVSLDTTDTGVTSPLLIAGLVMAGLYAVKGL